MTREKKIKYRVDLIAVTFEGRKKVRESVVKENIRTKEDWDLVDLLTNSTIQL